MTDTPTLIQARAELLIFATRSRPDWDPDRLEGAVLAAENAQWPWERIVHRVARMVTTPDEDPRDLLFEAGQTRAETNRRGGIPPSQRQALLEQLAAATRRQKADAEARAGGDP